MIEFMAFSPLEPIDPAWLMDQLPASVREPLRLACTLAENHQMRLSLVGGAVRDLFLHRPLSDLDFVVEGDAPSLCRELQHRLGGECLVHPRFRTATLRLPGSPALDFATARTETYPSPGALPEVQPASLTADLERRDFTVNAAAIPLHGPSAGQVVAHPRFYEDLNDHMLRVLHPLSFRDDPTRILRGVRYARRLGFQFHPATLALISPALDVLGSLSGERLRYELELILAEPAALAMLADLTDLGILSALSPQLPPLKLGTALAERIGRALTSVPEAHWELPPAAKSPQLRPWLGFLAWFAGLPAVDLDPLLSRFDLPGDLRRALHGQATIAAAFQSGDLSPARLTALLDAQPALAVYAFWLAHPNDPSAGLVLRYAREWRHLFPQTTSAVLSARGLPPGPLYGQILSRLRNAWLDGEIHSAEEEQILLAKLLSSQDMTPP